MILHSHLPPLNSPAYRRFVNEQLLARGSGPSHAQIGLTNACPQNCAYCYNKGRSGTVMDTATISRVIADLKSLGVFWLGLTGGEPLLNRDIVRIIERRRERLRRQALHHRGALTRGPRPPPCATPGCFPSP